MRSVFWRYISYISKYGLIPSAWTTINTELIKNSFHAMRLIRDDFLKLKLNKVYYVYSIGFIEHLAFIEIMDNHLKLLDNKIRLLIMIPNKKGLKWLSM